MSSRRRNERCKFWPTCYKGKRCEYHHPNKLCKLWPHCPHGQYCLDIHGKVRIRNRPRGGRKSSSSATSSSSSSSSSPSSPRGSSTSSASSPRRHTVQVEVEDEQEVGVDTTDNTLQVQVRRVVRFNSDDADRSHGNDNIEELNTYLGLDDELIDSWKAPVLASVAADADASSSKRRGSRVFSEEGEESVQVKVCSWNILWMNDLFQSDTPHRAAKVRKNNPKRQTKVMVRTRHVDTQGHTQESTSSWSSIVRNGLVKPDEEQPLATDEEEEGKEGAADSDVEKQEEEGEEEEEEEERYAAFLDKNLDRGVVDVRLLALFLAKAIQEIQPDLLTVIEGPNDILKMQLFVEEYLDDEYDVFGGKDGWDQRVYILVRRGGVLSNARVARDEDTASLKTKWEVDLDFSFQPTPYGFTRRPLVVDVDLMVPGQDQPRLFRVVGLHSKSKFVAHGQQMHRSEPREYIKASVKNRRRLLAEAFRIRKYLNGVEKKNPHMLCAVMGDLNDGPGLDQIEDVYLTSSSCDTISGSALFPRYIYRHAFLDLHHHSALFSVEHYDFVDEKRRRLLLDHILVSPALLRHRIDGGVCHDVYDTLTDEYEEQLNILLDEKNIRLSRGRTPRQLSDHKPVFATFRFHTPNVGTRVESSCTEEKEDEEE